MSLSEGQEVQHREFGNGKIVRVINQKTVKVKFDEEEFEKIVSVKYFKGYLSVGEAILAMQPSELPDAFAEHLSENSSQVDIRIHYPKHAEPYVIELFSREGIELPEDIRALNSGSKGGTTVQYTLAGEMWFPVPPAGIQIPGTFSEDDGTVKISSLAIILSVLKLGFPITKYQRRRND